MANKSQVNYSQTDFRSSTYAPDQQNVSKFSHNTPSQKMITESNNSDKKANIKAYGSSSKK